MGCSLKFMFAALFSLILLVPFSSAQLLGCNPGETRCYSETEQQTCNERALWDEPAACDNGAQCLDNACQISVGCMPGNRECTGQASYRVCNEYAIWGPSIDCAAGASCVGGTCSPAPQCSAKGELRCAPDGSNVLQACNSQLQWEVKSVCDYGCANSQCKSCRPSSTRCSDGRHVQQCDSGGNWGDISRCAEDEVCRNGVCEPDPSLNCNSPGSMRCSPSNGRVQQECGSGRRWQDYQVCRLGCSNGACRACSNGERSCRDGSTYYMCDSRGQWGLATSCPDGYSCFLGSCVRPEESRCGSIGQKRCSPSNASMTQVCNSNGVFVDYVACGMGCYNGECMECRPGAQYCDDSRSYKACGQDGKFGPAVQCAAGQECRGGACAAAAVCGEGQRQCAGAEVQACRNGQWVAYAACPSGSECTEAQGTAYCRENPQAVPQPPKPSGIFDGFFGFFKSIFGMN